MTDDFDDWLRDSDPPDELTVPAAAWDTAVETAFDPSYELTDDLTAPPGPDPLDADFDTDGDTDTTPTIFAEEPEDSGLDDDFGDTTDALSISDPDVFADDPTDDAPFEDLSIDDDF